MRTVERDVDRILTLLRNRIREHGFTQLEVQEALGWGRSYISQLLTKQKSLRVEQVLLILHVIDARPEDFWAELYPARVAPPDYPRTPPERGPADAALREEHRSMRTLLDCTVKLLTEKEYITENQLAVAVEEVRASEEARE